MTIISNSTDRLDLFLKLEGKTRTNIQKMIIEGKVKVNGNVVAKNYKLKINDIITVEDICEEKINLLPQSIPLDIVYEDEYLLVVNKPKGMVVHPACGNYADTLVNALLFHCNLSDCNKNDVNGELRPGIVHRIDKNTSGLLVVAKTNEAHIGLAEQIKQHTFTREYQAIVYGNIKQDSGVINLPIGRHSTQRKKMAVTYENSKEAITNFEVIKRYPKFTHLKLILQTGRTHQIRVHLSHLGFPVVGDDVYGPKKVITKLNGQCLHAKTIGFIHPVTNEYLYFDSNLPDYFVKFLKEIEEK